MYDILFLYFSIYLPPPVIRKDTMPLIYKLVTPPHSPDWVDLSMPLGPAGTALSMAVFLLETPRGWIRTFVMAQG